MRNSDSTAADRQTRRGRHPAARISTSADSNDHFDFASQEIGALKIHGVNVPLTAGRGNDTDVTDTLASGILGYEWDQDLDNGSRPAHEIRMSRSTHSVTATLAS